MPVYAGLMAMDDRLVQIIGVTDLCQFIGSSASNLQGSSRYAIRTSIADCQSGCRAILWPGGIETVRQARFSANHSLFGDSHFDDISAIQIDNAPGFITTFTQLPHGFMFEDADCVYSGSLSNDSIKICARQIGDGVATGKHLLYASLSLWSMLTVWVHRLGSLSAAAQRHQSLQRRTRLEGGCHGLNHPHRCL
jgi:hypothetical protein